MYEIIRKKRDGGELSREEIYTLINEYTAGKIPDYQMSAFLMAVYFRSMTSAEISNLTMAMAQSGDCVDLSELGNLSADKHSTGGVGDKTSLIVVPIAAALGCKVAKMSGRGLGHTGGTADKLEAIEGYKTDLSPMTLVSQAATVGAALATQSGNLAPADKKLYALRDVTATVDSIPLIASSIMSKKIASGAKNIVLDVKVGSGAFMKNIESAEKLARCMVEIGRSCGRNVRALITNMDVPLGNAVGNTLEVIEAVEILHGKGDKALLDISCILAAHMASMALDIDTQEALRRAYETIEKGSALKKFRQWIGAQGGDVSVVDDTTLFLRANIVKEVRAEKSGYIAAMDAEKIGEICVNLGGGRKTKEDAIDHAAGIIMTKKTGDFVDKGEVIAHLHTNKAAVIQEAERDYLHALTIGSESPAPTPLVYEVVE